MIGATHVARVVAASAVVFAGCTGRTPAPPVRSTPAAGGTATHAAIPPTGGRCANVYQPVVDSRLLVRLRNLVEERIRLRLRTAGGSVGHLYRQTRQL